jgi:hypothetical protein
MIIYTGQIARIRHPYLDITVKSGTGLARLLSPTWDMVLGVKRGVLSEVDYTGQYLDLLRYRYRHDRSGFICILTPENADAMTLACYCKPHTFCHRYLAVEVLEKIARAHGIPFEYGGEAPGMR